MDKIDPTTLDPKVLKVMKALRSVESGDGKGGGSNYNAIGDNGSSTGAFQWNNGKTPVAKGGIPVNYQSDAKKYGVDPTDFSPAAQNKVMYNKILAQKNAGLDPEEIAALHNGASKDTKTGKYIYNAPEYGVKFRTALNALNVSSDVSKNSPINYGEMTPAGTETGQLPGGGILKNMVTGALELPTSIGGGVLNAFSAGGRALGMNTPAQTSYPSLVGTDVAPIGYNEQGQELGGWQTTKQAAGAGLEAASYMAAPELKYLAAAGKASPLWKQLISGGVKTGIQGAEYAGGESLRTNPEDTLGALKNAGVGFGSGVVLGTGLSGVGALRNKLTGASKNLEAQINAAQGDEAATTAILNSPEGKTYLKSIGINSVDDVSKGLDNAYESFNTGVEEYYAKNNNMARKITNKTSRDDLHTVMEYAQDVPFKTENGKINTLETSKAIIADQKKVGESMSSIIDGMDMGGIDTSAPRDQLEVMIQQELDRIAATPGGATINKELAMKQIRNMIDNQVGAKNAVTMKAQHNLKVSANERYPTDPERSTKEAAGEALGNAIRGYQDNLIEAGAKSGSINATAVQAYKDLNSAWGKLERAKDAADIIAKTTKAPSRPRFMPEIVGGLASGGYNPLIYWGTQSATRGVLNSLDNSILRSRYGVQGININSSTVKQLIKSAENTKAGIASHIEGNTAKQMEAEASRKYAEEMIAKHGLPIVPESDSYQLGKDIQMGAKPVSKYQQPSNLPVAEGAPNVYSRQSGPQYEPYIPDNKLPIIRGMATPNQLNAMTALTGLTGLGGLAKKEYDKLTAEYGTEVFNRSDEDRANGIYRISGKPVQEEDLKELGAILYGEMSNNRTPEQYKAEAIKIARVAINRMFDKEWEGKSLKEILQQNKQFQAQGNTPYNEYLSGTEATTSDSKTKLKAVNDLIELIKSGDGLESSNRDLMYFHDKQDNVKTFSDYKNMVKNLSQMKGMK